MTKNNEAVSNRADQENISLPAEQTDSETQDYTFVHHKARIACYDDPLSEPHIIEVPPAPTREFLTNLAQTIWQQVRVWNSPIPYAVIADVSENFIHAQFNEMVVSIFDHGNTIRFSDQGPGIPHKELVQEWGFSTATEPMKEYIHGVGSGLPRVKEFLACKNGTISIQDNLGSGAVVTISFNETDTTDEEEFDEDFDDNVEYTSDMVSYHDEYTQNPQPYYPQASYQNPYQTPYPYSGIQPPNAYPQPSTYGYPPSYNQAYPSPYPPVTQQPYYNGATPSVPPTPGYYPPQPAPMNQPLPGGFQNAPIDIRSIAKSLTGRDREVLLCFKPGEYLRNKEIEGLCGLSASTVNNTLKKVEGLKLAKKMSDKSRILTDLGISVVNYLKQSNLTL